MLTRHLDAFERVDSPLTIEDSTKSATVRVETAYTLRGVSKTAFFEIAARPQARRRRACSMVSEAILEASPEKQRKKRLRDVVAKAEVRKRLLGLRCACLSMFMAQDFIDMEGGRNRRDSLAYGDLSSKLAA